MSKNMYLILKSTNELSIIANLTHTVPNEEDFSSSLTVMTELLGLTKSTPPNKQLLSILLHMLLSPTHNIIKN